MNKLFDDKELEPKPNADELPAEYAGKTPAELVQVIQAQKESQDAQEKRLNDLNTQVMDIARTKAAPAPVVQQTQDEPVDFYTKPQEAAEALFDKKMAPYKQAFLNNEEVRQMQELTKLPFYDDYKDQITNVMKSSHPDARAQAGFAKAAYDYVIGRNVDEVTEKKAKAKERTPEFTETKGSAAPASASEPELSDLEKRVAEGQGIPVDKYIGWRDKPDEMVAERLKKGA